MLAALMAAAAVSAPNLLFVTIDTLRADRVGAYGHAGAATGTLDRLGREGVVLEDAVVQVPQTRPSHASIFTGRYPFEHGLRDNYSARLEGRHPVLAEQLRRQGYATGAFIGAYPLARSSGLDRGFSHYDDPFGTGEASTTDEARLERPAKAVVDAALAWLQARDIAAPFFAWVHLFDPHAPYEAPAPFGTRFAKDPYDGEVAYADAELGRLLDWLDRSGLRGRTLVVATSDHGEGLGEHGEDEHLIFVYDTTLKVPAILSWPGVLPSGARVGGQFRSIDWVPTMLELLGQPPIAASGASRAGDLRAGRRLPDNESYAESLYGQLHYGWAPLRALRGEGWKHIVAPRPELFRLTEDPRERNNLAEVRPQVARAMAARLRALDTGAAPPAPEGPVDPAAVEKLAALGYVGGGFFTGAPTGDDPKDHIAWYEAQRRDVSAALRLYRRGDEDGALRLLERLARPTRDARGREVRPRSFNVSYTLGRILVGKRRYPEAAAHLQEAVDLAPTAAPAYVHLAQALAGARKPAEAEATLDRGLARAPSNAELLRARGGLRLRAGDATGARADLERARAAAPKDALVRVDLAALERQAGRLAAAEAEAREAVRLAPERPEAQVALGLVRAAQGDAPRATAAFRRALETESDHPDALFYLSAVFLQQGRPAEAASLLATLERRAPEYPGLAAALRAVRAGEQADRGAEAGPSPARRLQILRVPDAATAAEVVRRLQAGEDFSALARAHSTDASAPRGGDLGLVRLADLAEPLRQAAARLGPGETSPVLAHGGSYVVLRRP
jgi:arylsulfatase A-like enzyme/predicted Zn-dependent protease